LRPIFKIQTSPKERTSCGATPVSASSALSFARAADYGGLKPCFGQLALNELDESSKVPTVRLS
jgi:hypothetical protein